ANLFRDRHEVDLVHHRPWLTAERWSAFTSVDMSGVSLRCVPVIGSPFEYSGPAVSWNVAGKLRRWMAHLSAPYDLFIIVPPVAAAFWQASHGVLYMLFSLFDRRKAWMWSGKCAGAMGPIKDLVRRTVHERLWQQRMATYDLKWAISDFAKEWTKLRWG